jgi:FAD/FMN-containing dehydrogenase
MSKVAQYLQQHLLGEATSSAETRRGFETDAGIMRMLPSVVVYPRNENDVRKVARFSWQLAERGRVLPITARGAGTDLTGAALGSGVVLAFPAHMHRILVLDNKTGQVTVEPGINFGKIQQTLQTHGRFLPPFPASLEYSTVGGAVANNASGRKSLKYGTMRDFVKSVRVVLANGEVIETGRISKRELNKKLGLTNFEGEIYRALDGLLEENADKITQAEKPLTKNNAGYFLSDVKHKDGSFDLTPLIVGSQGSLGIITEIVLETEVDTPDSTLFMATFDEVAKAAQAVQELRELPQLPSSLELVDHTLLDMVSQLNPAQLKGSVDKPYPKIVLLVEFDNPSERTRKRLVKKADKIFGQLAASYRAETDPLEQEKLWKIREAAATVAAHSEDAVRAIPIIHDAIVPPEKLGEFLESARALFDKHKLNIPIWGHAGDANLHVEPFFDLKQIGHRQKAFRLMEDYYALVCDLGGSVAGESGEGRATVSFLSRVYNEDMLSLFEKVQRIFDPYHMLNPGVKTPAKLDDLKSSLRPDYSLAHLHHHPHS